MIGTRNKNDSPAQSIRVEIYNQTYNIRSDGDNEYIMRLAEYVDRKMREISSGIRSRTITLKKCLTESGIFLFSFYFSFAVLQSMQAEDPTAKRVQRRDDN
jgi:hypothetical protein